MFEVFKLTPEWSCCKHFRMARFDVSAAMADPMPFVEALAQGQPVYRSGDVEAPEPFNVNETGMVIGWVDRVFGWIDKDTGEPRYVAVNPAR